MKAELADTQTGSVGRQWDTGALADLAIILAVLVAVKQSVLLFSFFWGGPASTFTAMLVGTYLLRRRGLGWADLGLRMPNSWLKTFGLAVLVFGVMIVSSGTSSAIADMFFEDVGASGRFDYIEGNLWGYIGTLVIVWTHSAFFEELLFRAFIINRASAFLGGGLWADIAAVIFSAVFFGYRHYYYQGMNGAVTTGAIGLAFAIIYVWFGRKNMWPLILTHGTANTISMTMRFLGVKTD